MKPGNNALCVAALLCTMLQPRPATGQTALAPVPAVTLPASARVAEKVFGLPGLSKVGRVSPTLYRGAQPQAEGYTTLKSMGIKTVINLRSKHSEKEAVEAAGMKYIEIPMNPFRDVDEEAVRKAVALLKDANSHPVFLHCKHGKDRTGMIVAIYRMQIDGWPRAAAVAEMEDYDFNGALYHLKNYVNSYTAR